MTAVVLEVGPAAVRRIAPGPARRLAPGIAAAALRGIDDPVVLLDERPVDAAALWDLLIDASCGSSVRSLTIIVPTWWPRHRVDRVAAAAARRAGRVVTRTRAEMLARGGARTLIEIGDDVIAVIRADTTRVLHRAAAAESVVDAVLAVTGGVADSAVLLDAEAAAGGADVAGRIRKVLVQRGFSVGTAVLGDAARAAEAGPRRARTLTAASAAAVACAVGIAAVRADSPASESAPATTTLVEGRVTVRIPSGWTVERVTAGPGSKRIRITSAVDRDAALHVTQSYTPGESLSAAAVVLGSAVAAQDPGVFADFRPHAERAGRPAVIYRERRIGHDVDWTVLLDGSTRIGIGCQSAPGREDAISGPCEEAVRSAREIAGTERRQ